jgi:phosphoribosylformylglycinamidine synthase subunit PurS
MKVKIYVTMKKTVLDPQGKAVLHALHELGFQSVQSTRVGRFIELDVKGKDKKSVEKQVHQMCDKLLANSVIEEYSFEIE